MIRRISLPRQIGARHGGFWVAGALAATGAFFAVLSTRLEFGSWRLPGPGFFPFVLGLVLMGAAVAIAVGLAREPASGERVELGHRDVLIAMAALLAVPPLFEALGAYLTLGFLSVILLVGIGRVPILIATVASALGMCAVWGFFKVLLGLQLPNGPL